MVQGSEVHVDIRVLGSMEIAVDGVGVDVNSSSQRRIISALVVSRGEVVASERLADMAEMSLRALRTAVSRVRATVGDGVIVTQPGGYTLGAADVDADRFEAHLEEARDAAPADALAALDSALSLWRGDPYAECDETEWATPVVARLSELFASAVEDRAAALIALGRHADAAASMAEHTSQHPLRDRPVELLMRALAAQGRRTEALREFRQHRRRLLDDVGVEPGDQLVELNTTIAAGWHDVVKPASGAARARGNVGRVDTSFIGRDREVDEVISALRDHSLVTLIGVGGVGKTRLAIEVAIGFDQPTDGTWIVELGQVEDEDDVADAVARALGIRVESGLSSSESVLRWSQGRELLLILDNCEHVVRSAARLAETLSGESDEVRVLATSREALMAVGEHVRPVSPLDLPGEDGTLHGAAELFIDRSRAELPSFDPSDHVDAIVDICRRLDGLPLALELAAARVRGMSVEEIAARLDERFRLLTVGRRTAIERHATLRATVDWSYSMLDDIERSVFCVLSVFAGPFTLDDAVAMAADDIDEVDVIDALAHLVDRSLVVRGDATAGYRFLETLRAYGREQLDIEGTARKIARRHADLMVRKAARSRREAAGPHENDVIEMLRAQIADYASAVGWAVEQGDLDTAVRIAEDYFLPVSLWGENNDPGLWMCAILDSSFPTPALASANRFMAASWHLFFGNDARRALFLSTQAVEFDPTSASAHVVHCMSAMLCGDAATAVRAASTAQGLARDGIEEAYCFIVAGHAFLQTGDVEEAGTIAQAFVEWAEDMRYPSAIAMAHHLRGRTLAEGDIERAFRSFESGLSTARGEIPGNWVVELNLKRDMLPLVAHTRRDDAVEWASAILRESARHNETGQLLTAVAYTAVLLADSGVDEVAARAVGAAGRVLLAPRDAMIYEETKDALRARTGTGYDELVAQGARVPILRMAETVTGALTELRQRTAP